jgi:phosphatidylglycerol:prolipoprotein diacylglycerol transferase
MDVEQQDEEARTSDEFMAVLEHVAPQILAATSWFDPAPRSEPSPVTVRFSGHRTDVKKGRLRARDRFVQDETIEQVVAGSGPISVTARVHNINPGSWSVSAQVLGPVHAVHGLRMQEAATPAPGSLDPIVRFWRRWAPGASTDEPVNTCLLPFARVPGILPGVWGALATLGIVVALVLQSRLVSVDHLKVGPWWAVSLGAIVLGIVGGKVWYIVLYHSIQGWCIQGFITGATLTAVFLLVVLHIPVGVFLDATAPGLLFAMAVGRIGCFFAGCCGGPPTASRFGVWSSDQRVGARRIPTQLLESGLAGMLGLLVLIAFLSHGLAGGAYFAIGLAAYTLGRQGILYLRAERRRTKLGGLITAAVAVLALIAAIVLLAR